MLHSLSLELHVNASSSTWAGVKMESYTEDQISPLLWIYGSAISPQHGIFSLDSL